MSPCPPSSSVRSADGTTIGFYSLGDGPAVIVVGGAMRTAVDYLPLAEIMAHRSRVHVLDRRGRGLSGPLGPRYSIEREREDLLAVQAVTGARSVFGHSYGGLAVLHAATHAAIFERIAVYEPGVSIGGSIPTHWMRRYQQLLDHGDTRQAFAYFVQQSGHAPGPVAHLPLWYLRSILRLVVRKRQWARFEPLLAANLFEHQQVAACDGALATYSAVQAQVLLLAGRRSPHSPPSSPSTRCTRSSRAHRPRSWTGSTTTPQTRKHPPPWPNSSFPSSPPPPQKRDDHAARHPKPGPGPVGRSRRGTHERRRLTSAPRRMIDPEPSLCSPSCLASTPGESMAWATSKAIATSGRSENAAVLAPMEADFLLDGGDSDDVAGRPACLCDEAGGLVGSEGARRLSIDRDDGGVADADRAAGLVAVAGADVYVHFLELRSRIVVSGSRAPAANVRRGTPRRATARRRSRSTRSRAPC